MRQRSQGTSAVRLAEQVSPDHVDKIADRIADLAVDYILKMDQEASVGVEALYSGNITLLAGEIRAEGFAAPDLEPVLAEAIGRYLEEKRILVQDLQVRLGQQDVILRQASRKGSGDQSICIGFATAETPSMMPEEVIRAREITKYLWHKSQVEEGVGRDGKVVVIGTQSSWRAWIRWACSDQEVGNQLLREVRAEFDLAEVKVNRGALFPRSGGFFDTGVSGRKLICDFYGPRVSIGGGSMSGKDGSKVDRSGNYAAREVCCEWVRARGGWARSSIVYTLGLSEPIAAWIEGEDVEGHRYHEELGRKSLCVDAVVSRFALGKPERFSFVDLATFGHFGRALPWEQAKGWHSDVEGVVKSR